METDKKSKFLPPLITRDGLNYPKTGSWMRNVSFNKLATLAKNLDTSRSKNHPDKLHSIPTPWARLLLFESALYDKDHPAHEEVTNQWRGLLGLIGLAKVLGLEPKLNVPTFNLQAEAPGELKNAFNVLQPQHVMGGRDLEQNKWNDFGLIYFDGALLGGTSPRTIVFTGISHQCPPNVPFRSDQGRLSDPSTYYKQHDQQFLHVISQWVDHLITTVTGHNNLANFLGEQPSDPNAQTESRHRQLLAALNAWKEDLKGGTSGAVMIPAGSSRLPAPYDFVKHIDRIENGNGQGGDLFLRTNSNLIVCYRPHHESVIVDAYGNRVTGQSLRIFGPHLVQPNQVPPVNLDFLPPHMKVIEDPLNLFEDTLIEIDVIDSRAVFCLSVGKKNYLLPFKESLNEFFTDEEAAEIIRGINVSQPDGTTIRVTLTIPLVKGRSIRVHKDYQQEQDIISNDNLDLPTQELAMWPDFICPGEDKNGKPYFEHYFYYTNDQPTGSKRVQVEFTPLGQDPLKRTGRGKTWYMSKKPLLGFVGTVNDKQGLLLIKHAIQTPPTANWKVGVDFGSTHSSVFRRAVEQRDGKWFGLMGSTIEPITLRPRVKILTVGDAVQIQEMFFLYRASEKEGVAEHAITTQLSLPISDAEYSPNDWLPREGQVFLGSVLDTNSNNLHTDLKWNSDRSNFTTSSFLRSLLVMVEAEAIHSGAKIVHVSHSYPTAFPGALKNKQIEGWQAVQRCVNVPVDREPLSEALAVCRHLWAEQDAKPMANVVALDIGGSTTDIAVWSDGKLQMQESVKMAAGLAIKLIEGATEYGEWFSELMSKEEPFIRSRFNIQPSKKWNPRSYQAALKRLSEDGNMDSFIEVIKTAANTSQAVRDFLSPIVLLFAAVSYFAGLLTRKAGLTHSGQYYLYFCGKGGQLIRWMPYGETLVKEMFTAGLFIPDNQRPGVTVEISEYPKQEVGRGLLIERELDANQNHQAVEMFMEPQANVTAAEDGFPGVSWSDKLSFEKLNQLINNIPSTDKLVQLNRFVDTFASLELTRRIAEDYDMKDFSSDLQFKDYLKQRLSDNLRDGEGSALIEPLFITETKILIERMTNQSRLFD